MPLYAVSMAALPSPDGKLLTGHISGFRDHPELFFQEAAKECGDLFKIRLGWKTIICLNHPDYIEQVLVKDSKIMHKSQGVRLTKFMLGEGLLTSEAPFHRRQRRLIQPAFHPGRMDRYKTYMLDAVEQVTKEWPLTGDSIDMHAEMMKIALFVASRSLFDADVSRDAPDVGKALEDAMGDFDRVVSNPLGKLILALPTKTGRRFKKARKRLDKIVYRMISERKKELNENRDFLSLLLASEDEDGKMTDLQIRDEAMTFFLAGHETTANAMAWSLALLARHPEAVQKAREDIEKNGEQSEYVRSVFAETMRMYPPAWALGRESIAPTEIGGHKFPKGTTFFMSQYAVHRDPRWWKDPDLFRPERWMNEKEKSMKSRFCYFPFGGGPRICIGESFAWLEGRLVLTNLIRNFNFELTEWPDTQALVTLRPKDGIPMKVKAV